MFSRADFSGTNLHRLLAAAPSPAALILYRATPIERLEAASRDARAAGAVVRAAQLGQVSPGEAAATPIDLRLIPAMVMELGQYSRERLEQEQKQWGGGATRGAEALPATTPELLWANSASQTLDRFDPKAGAVLVLIGPDKKVIRVIPVDGRASNPAALAAELRAALGALGRP